MSENRFILSAFALSLVLHLVLVAVLWRVPLRLDTAVANAGEPDWDDLVVDILPPEPEDRSNSSLPERFTMVPERLATEEAPEDPDYASLFNARAMDREEGGEGDVPKAAREGDFEQVTILEDGLPASEGVQFTRESVPAPSPQQPATAAGGEVGEAEDPPGVEASDQGSWLLPDEEPEPRPDEGRTDQEGDPDSADEPREQDLAEWWGEQSPSIVREGQGNPGDRGFDFNQLETGRPGVGVSFVGDYSLNTYEWNYAPWMKTFMSQLQRHWKAPYAYSYLGMIHGETRLQVVVSRSGRLVSLEILDTEGHQSLHEASEAAMRAFAPYTALPEGFPEDELVMTWRLIYPALRR